MHDRAPSKGMPLTHEFLADLLGVNRTSITLAARALQRAGLIDYRRGNVTIIDRLSDREIENQDHFTKMRITAEAKLKQPI